MTEYEFERIIQVSYSPAELLALWRWTDIMVEAWTKKHGQLHS